MSQEKPVGLTKGPGETPHEFTFVSPDRAQALKVGEYVIYRAEADGAVRQVLARVTSRRPVRSYPDAFLAEPGVSPDEVARLVGYERRSSELFEIAAMDIGYYDQSLGDFINPRIPPHMGRPIYMASSDDLSRVLTKRRAAEVGAAHVGSLLSRPPDEVPIVLDLAAITSTHLAILANTGAGKSYLAAVLIEEMMKPQNRAAVLVVDPHGEYDTLSEMVNSDAFTEAGSAGSLRPAYRPEVKIFKPGEVKVRSSSLTMGDLRYLLPSLSERMDYLLSRAYRAVCKRSEDETREPDRWTLAELEIRLTQLGESDETGEEDERYADTAKALIWRLDSVLKHSIIFDDFRHLDLGDLCRPGRCSVLQLNEVNEREQRVVVATLLRRLFHARTQTAKGKAGERDDLYLPYPVFVLIEEAHRFAPASADVVSTDVLKQVMGEGRKFGVAVGLISQRPGKLDADALSQCNTQFILRIVNPVDQARIAESVESVGRDLLDELPALTKGQAIIAGAAVNTPLLCRVRKRHTRHGAEDVPAPAIWVEYCSEAAQSRREREEALPAVPNRQGQSRMYK